MQNPTVQMSAQIVSPGASVTVGPDMRFSVQIDAWGVVLTSGGGGGVGNGSGGGGSGGGGSVDDGGGGAGGIQSHAPPETPQSIAVDAGRVMVRLGSGPFRQATKSQSPHLPRRWSLTGTAEGSGSLQITVRAEPPHTFQGQAAIASRTVAVSVDSPIDWQPSVMRPVFYGHRDFSAGGRLPVDCRMFFPSIDGSPSSAAILSRRMPYPLVLFVHGNCTNEDGHYLKWFRLPATLAMAGYVVAVPDLPGIRTGVVVQNPDHPDFSRVVALHDWIRNDWTHGGLLAPVGDAALIGHSRGAALAGLLLDAIPAKAIVSLSGEWGDVTGVERELPVPVLFMEGTGDMMGGSLDGIWSELPTPRHQAQHEGAGHWDYLPAGSTRCEQQFGHERGPCTLTEALAAELAALFIARYLPPDMTEVAGSNPVPASLDPPEVELTNDQRFFAGGHHLGGLRAVEQDSDCEVGLRWDTGSETGTRVLG